MNTSKLILTLLAFSGIVAAMAYSPSDPTRQSCCGAASSPQDGAQKATSAQLKNGVQYATIIADGGYKPGTITAKAGTRLELTFKLGAKPGCASTVIFPSLKIKKSISAGKGVVIKFTPEKAGEVPFECGMGMYKGKIIVK